MSDSSQFQPSIVSSPSSSSYHGYAQDALSLDVVRRPPLHPLILRPRRRPKSIVPPPATDSPPSSPKLTPLPLPLPEPSSEANPEDKPPSGANIDQTVNTNAESPSLNSQSLAGMPSGSVGWAGFTDPSKSSAMEPLELHSNLDLLASQVADVSAFDQSVLYTPPSRKYRRENESGSDLRESRRTTGSRKRGIRASTDGFDALINVVTGQNSPHRSSHDLRSFRNPSAEHNFENYSSEHAGDWEAVMDRARYLLGQCGETLRIVREGTAPDGKIELDAEIAKNLLKSLDEQRMSAGFIIVHAERVLGKIKRGASEHL